LVSGGRVTRAVLLGLAMVMLLGGAPDPRDRGPDKIDVSRFPPKYQELYQVFEVRCSKCHSLARPVNAKLRPDEWKLYVKKMARRQGSGINEETGAKLTDFLTYYSLNRDGPDAGVP
jgi:hypothetical protein